MKTGDNGMAVNPETSTVRGIDILIILHIYVTEVVNEKNRKNFNKTFFGGQF